MDETTRFLTASLQPPCLSSQVAKPGRGGEHPTGVQDGIGGLEFPNSQERLPPAMLETSPGTLRQQGREEETGSRRVSVFRGDMCPGTHVPPP